jgi:hypothetical protein
MEPVLRHFRSERRQLQDLVAERVRVLPPKGMPAPAALGRLDNFRVIGGQQGAPPPLVPGLAAGPAAGGSARRPAFDSRRVGGGRPRGVGGVLVEAVLQLSDLLLEAPHGGPQLGRFSPQRQDQGTGLGRQAVPQFG